MTEHLIHLLHQALFGALAASGFGILFNFNWRNILWCAASGALALLVRTLGQQADCTLETSSFMAAAAVGCAARFLNARLGIGFNSLAAAGCIPMVPGFFAAEGLSALYALTAVHPNNAAATAVSALEFTLRASFTVVGIGAGLAITTHMSKKAA